MNLERRLRDAFAHRAEAVEPSPGALFDIQGEIRRRVSRTRRGPELRLRPALVIAAAACALAIVLVTTLTGTDPVPDREIAVASPATPDPTTPGPTGTPPPPTTPDPTTPAPPTPAPPTPGEIATVDPPVDDSPVTAPPAGPSASPPQPPPPAGPSASPPQPPPPAGQQTTAVTEPAPACPTEPTGNRVPAEETAWVTVYFACGDDDTAPRKRAAAVNDLPTALSTLVAGPNDGDAEAGFSGLRRDLALSALPARDGRWVTVDLPGNLAEAFGPVTAEQFVSQLNATVFEFDDVGVAEYRLDGSCAAFGALLGRPCEVHTRNQSTPDGAPFVTFVSELTTHTIGGSAPAIRSEPNSGSAELGTLTRGTRLTDRREIGPATTWAQVITTDGGLGWITTESLAAQPLEITAAATATMESLARRLTTGPGLDAADFSPAGLVLRWGAESDDTAVIPTDDLGAGGDWWYRARDIPSPRDGGPTGSLTDLLWIDGAGGSAQVTINLPGPLGEPHSSFASLAYVSIYQASVGTSTLPPALATDPQPVAVTPDDDELDLPPAMPGLTDPDDEDPASEPETPTSQVKVSVIFDFASPSEPRIVAVEAIWRSLQ